MGSKRPRTSIEAIVTYNTTDQNGQWIPITIHKGTWILMQQNKRIKSSTKNSFLTGWKGIVKDFSFGDNKKSIKEVLVQHVYMHNDLHIDSESSVLPLHRPNCKTLYLNPLTLICKHVVQIYCYKYGYLLYRFVSFKHYGMPASRMC